jgi:hypothetical protein
VRLRTSEWILLAAEDVILVKCAFLTQRAAILNWQYLIMFLQIQRAGNSYRDGNNGTFTPDTSELLPNCTVHSVERCIFVRDFLACAVLALSPARKFNEPILR